MGYRYRVVPYCIGCEGFVQPRKGQAEASKTKLVLLYTKKISVTHRLASTLQCFLPIEMTIKLVTMCYSNAAKSWTTAMLIGKPSANG
jgi:hypothetical protein